MLSFPEKGFFVEWPSSLVCELVLSSKVYPEFTKYKMSSFFALGHCVGYVTISYLSIESAFLEDVELGSVYETSLEHT